MNSPSPALVTERGAGRLPRWVLLLLCAAYVLPGLFGRDPWRNADMAAFGQMLAIAQGRSTWLTPTLGGVAVDSAVLPHWLGAAFIHVLSPALGAPLAARVPFALLLALTLALVWYTTFHLARTEAAQPVPLAFGGEANPVDYARVIADGAVLALMATLGLLQLGHETTPELAQLFAISLFAYALAAAPWRRSLSVLAALVALPLLAGSGAPSMAMALGLAGLVVCHRSGYETVRKFVAWLGLALALALLLALWLGVWGWRALPLSPDDLRGLLRQWLWFTWPAWPLALWTLWRWRRHLLRRHIAVPLVGVLVALGANLAMDGSDRALMLALPGLAVLAAFALPTLKRGATAAIDWFSMIFFTLCAVTIWVIYLAMHTGWPAKPAANLARLVPEYMASFSTLALLLAVAGSAAWLALVRWRTGRHREALWKSLILPSGGVALCWLLLMSLWLPLLDYAKSPRAYVERLAKHIPPSACIAAPGQSPAAIAALEFFGPWRVDARPVPSVTECDHLLRIVRLDRGTAAPGAVAGWDLLAVVRRPTEREELSYIYRRRAP